jgi:DNA-binding XRE family transcriptional regulator
MMHERIKMLRKYLNLTQQAFAGRIGLKQNSIALIESGKRKYFKSGHLWYLP